MLEFDIDKKACAGCRALLHYFFKAGFLIGGRITVMVTPSQNNDPEGDRIIASALWLPPQTGLASWQAFTMVKADIIPFLKCWGLTGWQVRNSNVLICLKLLNKTPLREFI